MSDVIEAMAVHAFAESSSDARMAMRAALRIAEQAGWRLVPVEPTTNQKLAGWEIIDRKRQRGVIPTPIDMPQQVYTAMTEAAPRPWADQDEVEG